MISNPQVYLKANNGLVVYFINGDSLGATTKKDCEYRISSIFFILYNIIYRLNYVALPYGFK